MIKNEDRGCSKGTRSWERSELMETDEAQKLHWGREGRRKKRVGTTIEKSLPFFSITEIYVPPAPLDLLFALNSTVSYSLMCAEA